MLCELLGKPAHYVALLPIFATSCMLAASFAFVSGMNFAILGSFRA